MLLLLVLLLLLLLLLRRSGREKDDCSTDVSCAGKTGEMARFMSSSAGANRMRFLHGLASIVESVLSVLVIPGIRITC